MNNNLSPANNVVLRDYRHAARIFTDDNMRLSPKYGFLFYVEFDFNPGISEISTQGMRELGMIVKNIDLPKYTVDVKVHNAYNRPNIVQNKIKYDPVTITFHDDQADNVKQFWYDYYSFFYRDPDYADATYQATHKYDRRPSFEWGYTPRPTAGFTTYNAIQPYQYIQAIRIYSLYQKQFSEYQLVNPTITSFKHGSLSVSENGTLENQLSVQFETVKYLEGSVTHSTAGGFIDLHYDNTPSPIAPRSGIPSESDVVTDLANSTTSLNSMMRQPNTSFQGETQWQPNNFGSAMSTSLQNGVRWSTYGGINNGGFSIPSLGGLTTGLTNSAMVGQQLQAAGIGIASRSINQIAGSVVNGVAQGLGPNGGTIIGMAAAAIQNPAAALRTVENMAISYATGIVSGAVQNALAPITAGIQSSISGFIGDKITSPISTAWGEASGYLQNQYADISSQFNVAQLNDNVAGTFASGSDTSWFSSQSFD